VNVAGAPWCGFVGASLPPPIRPGRLTDHSRAGDAQPSRERPSSDGRTQHTSRRTRVPGRPPSAGGATEAGPSGAGAARRHQDPMRAAECVGCRNRRWISLPRVGAVPRAPNGDVAAGASGRRTDHADLHRHRGAGAGRARCRFGHRHPEASGCIPNPRGRHARRRGRERQPGRRRQRHAARRRRRRRHAQGRRGERPPDRRTWRGSPHRRVRHRPLLLQGPAGGRGQVHRLHTRRGPDPGGRQPARWGAHPRRAGR
jgi:hypothetical protein